MNVWGWIAGILAGVGIIILLTAGDADHNFFGRDREAIFEGPPQALISAPAAVGAEYAMTIVVAQDEAPPEVAPVLQEVQQLLGTAANQPPEEAKPTLQAARDKLNDAIDQVDKAADDTSNDLKKIRLIRLSMILNRIEELIQIRLDRL